MNLCNAKLATVAGLQNGLLMWAVVRVNRLKEPLLKGAASDVLLPHQYGEVVACGAATGEMDMLQAIVSAYADPAKRLMIDIPCDA